MRRPDLLCAIIRREVMFPLFRYVTLILQIVLIDVVLSGDNAVVIALASHRLPAAQRRLAILFGMGGAVGLRVLFTWLVALLLDAPLLRFGGGVVLVWIAIKLFVKESENEGKSRAAREGSFLFAVWTIIVADFVMSLDNMLAVGGASQGDWKLILFGLMLSITIIMSCSVLISELMNRFPIVVVIGAGVLALTAAEMILRDQTVARFFVESRHICLANAWHKNFADILQPGIEHYHWIGNCLIIAVIFTVISSPHWPKLIPNWKASEKL